MQTASTAQLKRPTDESVADGPPSKRRNTGNVTDLRRTRKINPVDPLNLLNATAQDHSTSGHNDRKRRFEDAHAVSGSLHNRRQSFRGGQSKKSSDNLATSSSTEEAKLQKSKQLDLNRRYRYGNFNYFHRLNAPFINDLRLDLLVDDWFKDKSVLDVGCNAGTLTLSIARAFQPARILGVDIDSHLIGAARKNIRHFQDKDLKIIGKFPASFALNFGPITGPSSSTSQNFPDNVWFRQENYVLESDHKLESVREQYDTVVAFALTKWIHLNFGDDGLKRFFKRVFRALKPGGRFILEVQSSRGYKKRAKMIPEMEKTYKTIRFWPEQFCDYLMSAEVGFAHFEALDTPLVQMLETDPLLMLIKGPLFWHHEPIPEPMFDFQETASIQYISTPRGEDSASTPQYDQVSQASTPDHQETTRPTH